MIGKQVHNYHINAHLGQGGMGNVFRATDNTLGREVALKMLHPQLTMEPQFLDRFKKEARVLAQLLHPNIAVIYNLIEQDHNHFMAMEYVEGVTLDELQRKYQAIPAKLLVPVCIQALEGLHHAHKKNIFHRDIKPANLMLTPDGILKLMDFGIARVAGEQKMTQVNKIVGTIEFMAPELIEGKQASVASDVYAMGASMYELVSGKLPFESDTDFNLMQAILRKKVKAPDKLRSGVPKALSDIILKAMEKKPEDRYRSAKEFQQALLQAFPNYREIDVSLLHDIQHPGYETRLADAPTVYADNALITEISTQTRIETGYESKSIRQRLEQAIFNKRFPYIMVTCGLVILAAIIVGISISNGKRKAAALARIEKEDSLKKATKIIAEPVPIAPVISQTPVEPPEGKTIKVTPLHAKTEIERPAKKKAPGKDNNSDKKNTVLIAGPEEKKQPEPVIPKPAEKKEVFIDDKVEVNLYLRDNLEESEREKDKPVSFSVTNAVVYDGVTIIRQGAIATGNIDIGRIMTSITISSVKAANGQELQFKSARFHRKRRDLATDRNYSATLQKGIRMSF